MSNAWKAFICICLIVLGGTVWEIGCTKNSPHEGVPYILGGVALWLVCGIIVFFDYLNKK